MESLLVSSKNISVGSRQVVRKGTSAGSCFTPVIGISSGTHPQAMDVDSSTDTPFAAAGTGAVGAAGG